MSYAEPIEAKWLSFKEFISSQFLSNFHKTFYKSISIEKNWLLMFGFLVDWLKLKLVMSFVVNLYKIILNHVQKQKQENNFVIKTAIKI